MVQEMGLEPTQDCSHKHLKLARLPIPPPLRTRRHFRRLYHYITKILYCQYLFSNFLFFSSFQFVSYVELFTKLRKNDVIFVRTHLRKGSQDTLLPDSCLFGKSVVFGFKL